MDLEAEIAELEERRAADVAERKAADPDDGMAAVIGKVFAAVEHKMRVDAEAPHVVTRVFSC